MTTLNTLNSLIDDILEEARNNNVSQAESLSRIQIEQWIHGYRALLLKQDLDKGRYTNPNYIQVLNIKAIYNGVDGSNIGSFKSEDPLPTTIDLHFKQGFTNIQTVYNEELVEIQLVPQSRTYFQKYRKYAVTQPVAAIRDGYLIVTEYRTDLEDLTGEDFISITVRGIFEDPSLVPGFDANAVYPISGNMIPALKELIFKKEFGLMLNMPTDETNDSHNDMNNVSRKQ